MNAVLQPRLPVVTEARAPARIALLGTGTVGDAVLQRLAAWAGSEHGERLSLVYAANSRAASRDAFGLCPRSARSLAHTPVTARACPDDVAQVFAGHAGTCIVIDATASDAIAGRHAHWLGQGIHVVTACKLGPGTSLARWRAIRDACAQGGTRYGDSATVGAGLPLLHSIRRLRHGGDRIHAIAGVLSGSLAWLFHHYDGLRPFSRLVREARAAGYTEPDPREDLSGDDVRRKLLILARAAGVELEAEGVEVASLVPAALAALARDEVDAALPQIDTVLRERCIAARRCGEELRFIARLECPEGGRIVARVGLESLPASDPLAGGAGTDNRVAIWSDRYATRPLLVQGPGAGAQVTAAALLDDALRIAGAAGAFSTR